MNTVSCTCRSYGQGYQAEVCIQAYKPETADPHSFDPGEFINQGH